LASHWALASAKALYEKAGSEKSRDEATVVRVVEPPHVSIFIPFG
jgi:hypothetical protein